MLGHWYVYYYWCGSCSLVSINYQNINFSLDIFFEHFHVLLQNSTASKEIISLNNVIKCIEVHKFEPQMPTKDLEKLVVQL